VLVLHLGLFGRLGLELLVGREEGLLGEEKGGAVGKVYYVIFVASVVPRDLLVVGEIPFAVYSEFVLHSLGLQELHQVVSGLLRTQFLSKLLVA
jgi:hypothetical protein